MIFVTVGTHERPFDRLLSEIDLLAASGEWLEDVFCQCGTTGLVLGVPAAPMLSYGEMQDRMMAASVVVSHGGPATILSVLAADTPLVAVPRRRRFGEHVDDHQVSFCRHLKQERGILVVEDIKTLAATIAKARDGGGVVPRSGALPGLAVAELARRIEELLGSA